MKKDISKKEILEFLEYIRSDETKEKTRNNLLNQITEYLNEKYVDVDISYTIDGDKGNFKIEGGTTKEKLEILQYLKGMGVLP